MRDLLTTPMETIEADLEALQSTTSHSPVLESSQEPDVTVYWSDLPLAVCNVIANAQIAPARVPVRVPELLGPFLERGLPFEWRTTPETTTPALEAALAQAGLRAREYPAMLTVLEEPLDPGLPNDIYVDVAWPDRLAPIVAAIFAGFDHPRGRHGEHLRLLDDLDPTLNHGFGARSLITGGMVGAGTTHRRGDSVMLANLTTLPEARGRGIGSGLTATMMNRARETGARTATVVANDASYQMYVDLGFRTRFDVVTWVWEPTD